MPLSSSHTILINKLINLSVKHNKLCEPILYNNQYELDAVEVKFIKMDGRKISPDILIKNSKLNRLLFIECKDGALDPDQAGRYDALTTEDIINAKITNLDGDIKHEVAYAATEAKIEKLVKGISKEAFKFPVLSSGDARIFLKLNHFDCDILEKLFTNDGVSIENYSDTFYPFGADDSDEYILFRLIPVLLKFVDEEFDPEDLLIYTHEIFRNISKSAMGELKRRVGTILKDASKDEKLGKYFDHNIGKKFRLKRSGKRALKKAIENYIEGKFDNNQKSLIDF